ncbi:hypothetical protein [Arthrobacter sp. RIT-PI-e]|uniref:hypothetical protein n=1 Tax=Arthrobacter sp. RIT-PI-e TaxID=1681197 RepID=UPI0013648FCE|nr:hypothetical protein [Arthrobacter sp. RIT-PI-e]
MTPGPQPSSHWLDAEPSGENPEEAARPTLLRSLAHRWSLRRVQLLNSWGVTVLLLVALVIVPAEVVLPGILGLAAGLFLLFAIAFTAYCRYRPLPSPVGLDREVWVRTPGRGALAGVLAVIAVSLVLLIPYLTNGVGPSTWSIGLWGMYGAVCTASFVLQGWHHRHARRLFRHHIANNGKARAALEGLSMNPPAAGAGTRGAFGPL